MRFLILRIAASMLVASLMSTLAYAVDSGPDQQHTPMSASDAVDTEVPGAPVRLDGRTLFKVRGSTSLPALARATAISERIVAVASDPAVMPESVTVVTTPLGEAIMAGKTRVMTVTPLDGDFESVPYKLAAASHALQLRDALQLYRVERAPEKFARGAAISAIDTVLLLVTWWLVLIGFRRLDTRLSHIHSRKSESAPVVGRHGSELTIQSVGHGALSASRWLISLVLLYVWLQHVLAQFPATRWLSDGLTGFIVDPLLTISEAVADYLPNLIFLLVLFFLTRYGIRLLRYYFSTVERGTTRLPNFEPEWSVPTYKLVRTVVIGLALIMGYPYLPGAGTDALKGLSLFAGLLFSLGASTSVSGVISGYINTFGRVFRVGDLIKVGEVLGTVTQVRLLNTRVCTIRNEEVTIPNSTITNSSLLNYTALARERGLILQTQVGIGYEVPWRQVHAMLLEAAARTPGLLTEPTPFIYQLELGDFAVVYQLNVYQGSAKGIFATRSTLHQNILDLFNENGVQIMTPAYEGDPAEPKVVTKDRWFTPTADAHKSR